MTLLKKQEKNPWKNNETEKIYQIKTEIPTVKLEFAPLFIVSSTHFSCISISTSLSIHKIQGKHSYRQFASHHLVKGSKACDLPQEHSPAAHVKHQYRYACGTVRGYKL